MKRLVDKGSCQRNPIVATVHDSCHLGINRTLDMLGTNYYWPRLTKDVKDYVSCNTSIDNILLALTLCAKLMQVMSCERCMRNNPKLHEASGVLHPIPVKPTVWSQVVMHLIAPLPETIRGNKYVITLTNYFTKWAEAAPLPNKTGCYYRSVT